MADYAEIISALEEAQRLANWHGCKYALVDTDGRGITVCPYIDAIGHQILEIVSPEEGLI